MNKGIVIYIVIIIVILAIVFLSQQSNFKEFGKNLFSLSQGYNKTGEYMANGSNWVKDNILSKIGGEVQKRGDMAKEGITEQKEKISENVGEKIKNYFAGIVDSVFHPGENNSPTESSNNCPPCQQIQYSPYQTSQP
jgi:predicted PurR-regulated permease PerM